MRINTLICMAGVPLFMICTAYGYSETFVPDEFSLSSRSTMSDSELKVFMRDWKAAREQSLLKDPIDVLGRVTTKMQFPNGTVLEVLKYNNKEIVKCVTDLYIAECQRNWTSSIHGLEVALKSENDPERIVMLEMILSLARRRLQVSITRDGKRFDDALFDEPLRHSGEAELEYHDYLAAVAESTFSEQIYPYIFSTFQVAEMRGYYLAFVRPSDTLEAFLNASVGEWQGVPLYPHFLYLPDAAGTEFVDGAMRSLLTMIENNEQFRVAQAAKIIEFVDKHALHFADPTLPTPKDEDETRYRRSMSIHDYRTRADALRIISAIGTSSDIPLVLRLMKNSPDPAPPTRTNPTPVPITELGLEVERRLAARTVE